MTTTTSTCSNCRGALLPGDRFCGHCGTVVAAPTPAAGLASPTTPTRIAPTAAGVTADASPWAGIAARLQSATLGDFEIFTELGRGGMAAVFLARDLALNRRVAIKVMAPGLLHGTGMIERFKQEAVTVANLQHGHIVSIYAVRQIGDLHFFVMQFVPGRTLDGVVRDVGALPIPVVRAWLYQIGSALGYAHRRGVIHRDIKPGNILLNADGEAIVTDFGIAKVAESPNQTQTGTVVGTPVYMSPEQCYAKELTGASDQYSLGIVAYEMLVGRPPFAGSSFMLMRSHTDEPPPPIRDTRADVPAETEAAVMRMLAKTPEERFPSLGEALVALGAAPLAPDDPLHAMLQELASATHRLDQLADLMRTPASPVPQTRERPKQPLVVDATAPARTPAPTPAPPAAPTSVPPPTAKPERQAARSAGSRGLMQWLVPAALVAIAGGAYVAMKPTAAGPPIRDSASGQQPVTTPATVPNVAVASTVDSVPARDSVGAQAPTVDSLAATKKAPSPVLAGTASAPPTTKSALPSTASAPPPALARAESAPRRIDNRPTRPETTSTKPSTPPAATVPAAPAPNVVATAPPKSEAELRTEIQTVITSYARAIELRDTSMIRRVFPNAGSELMSRWQTTFDDARGAIAMNRRMIDIPDTPRDASGTQVTARAEYSARFSSKAARSDQSFPVAFTAVLQRDAATWHIIGIR